MPDGKRFSPSGRDNGACHSTDAIEIFLVPEMDKKQYLQFAFNPVSNSFADYKGTIQDSYVQSDRSWNPAWTYSVQRKNNVWTSHVVIPFAAIGSSTTKGVKWKFNLSRASHPVKRSAFGEEPGAENKRTNDFRPELSSWAPSMESRFNDIDTFGILHF